MLLLTPDRSVSPSRKMSSRTQMLNLSRTATCLFPHSTAVFEYCFHFHFVFLLSILVFVFQSFHNTCFISHFCSFISFFHITFLMHALYVILYVIIYGVVFFLSCLHVMNYLFFFSNL